MTEGKQLTIADTLRKMQPEFQAALPPHISPERFTRVAVTAVNSNPDLLKPDVDKRSIYAACMKAAQDGLIIDNREAALVIFKGRAQYMPMIDGIMKLVRNSGEISVWSVHVVKEHDKFDYELGDDEFMKHKPALTNRGKTIGAYSIVTLKDGSKSREWMDIEQIEAIRKRSRSGTSGPWVTDFDEMARKTVAKRHAKRLPKSTDLDDILRDEDDPASDRNGEVVSIRTASAVEDADAAPRKRQTRAAAAVKAAVAEPDPQIDDNIIDAEHTDVTDDGLVIEIPDDELPM